MEQSELLQFVIGILERLQIPYAIVGSFASGIWGESRFTQDIDIVVRLDERAGRQLAAEFPSEKFYVSPAAVAEAVQLGRPFNVVHPESGNKIDFMVVRPQDWSDLQLARRVRVELSRDCYGYVAAPEDVILGKLVYYKEGGSDKHLRDIAGILKVSGSIVDHNYLAQQAGKLGLSDVWHSIEEASN